LQKCKPFLLDLKPFYEGHDF